MKGASIIYIFFILLLPFLHASDFYVPGLASIR